MRRSSKKPNRISTSSARATRLKSSRRNEAYYGADVRPANAIVKRDVKPNQRSKDSHDMLVKTAGGK